MATLKVKGLPELIKKAGPSLYVDPVNKAVKAGGQVMLRAARSRVPVAEGTLKSSISEQYKPQPMGMVSAGVTYMGGKDLWIIGTALNAGKRITTSRKRAKALGLSFERYSYGKKKLANGRLRRYKNKKFNATEVVFHYQSGPSKGKRTRGWLTGVPRLRPVQREVEALVNKAAGEIEAAWRR